MENQWWLDLLPEENDEYFHLQNLCNTNTISNIGVMHDANTAWWTSLAQRSQPGVFQAGNDCSPMSERPRPTVYLSDYCVPIAGADSRRHCVLPTVNYLHSLPAQHFWPSGLFSCRPHSLELSPGFHLGPDHQCILFQTFAQNGVRSSAFSALEVLDHNRAI